jgi:hypothetical protein
MGRKPEADHELEKAAQVEHEEAGKKRTIRILDPGSANAAGTQPQKLPPK